MNEPRISVIVPVYNGEEYLAQCLASICMQDYQNWECIAVDDGSTDASGTILASYAAKDSRFRVVQEENEGSAAARNHALDLVRGDYVMFLDCDDRWLDKQMMSELVTKAERENWDIIIFGGIQIRSHGRRRNSPDLNEKAVPAEIFADLMAFRSSPAVWNKFYKKELWDHVRFPEGMLSEDFYIMPDIFVQTDRIVNLNKKWYAYNRMRLSSSRQVARITADMLQGWERRLVMAEKGIWQVTEDTLREMRQQTAKMALRLLIREVKGDILKAADKEHAERMLAANKKYLRNGRYRLRYSLYKHCPWIYK